MTIMTSANDSLCGLLRIRTIYLASGLRGYSFELDMESIKEVNIAEYIANNVCDFNLTNYLIVC